MIDQELKQRALTPAAKGEAAPREKILKLGKKITDVVDHKLGKVSAEDAEYWGLAGVVTDEMAALALTTMTTTGALRRPRSGGISCRCSCRAARSCSTWRRMRSFRAGTPGWSSIRSLPSSVSA